MTRFSVFPVLTAAALAASAVICAPAAADPSRLSPAIGNTIVSTHPDGRTARLKLHADHSYAAEGRKGQKSSGVWSLKGEKLCLSQKKPYPGPFPVCKAVPRVAVGASWRDTAFNGETVTNRIVAGD